MKKETPERVIKRHEREQRELVLREKQSAKKKPHYYLWYLFLILSLAFVADEVASIITIQVQHDIIEDLFVPLTGTADYGTGLSLYQTLGYVIYPVMLLAFIYKPLADRFGRKPFLVINTIGMALGMLIVFLSEDVYVYFIGYALMMFFVMHDMHSVYIVEVSSPKWRGTSYGITKFFAVLGTMLIPLSKSLFMDNMSLSWHYVLLTPSIFGFTVAFLALFFARETDPFLKQRIGYLEMSDEQRAEKKRKEKEGQAQGGLIPAFKFCFKHKQLRYLLIAAGLFYLASIVTSTYESVMSKSAMMAATDITTALWYYSISNAIMQLIGGFISDEKGRKPAVIAMTSIAVACYIVFVFAAMDLWSPVIVGLMVGGFIGAYWAAGDTIGNIMLAESIPTNLRSSGGTVQTVVFGIFGLIGQVTFIVVQLYVKTANLGYAYMIWLVPWLLLSLLFSFIKTKETLGNDMEKVTGLEEDDKEKAGQP